MPRRLDFIVNSVAAQLMDADASTATEVSQQVLAYLVEQFDVEAAFLRENDHNIGASKLIAEWPPRPGRPNPDPLEVVDFAVRQSAHECYFDLTRRDEPHRPRAK